MPGEPAGPVVLQPLSVWKANLTRIMSSSSARVYGAPRGLGFEPLAEGLVVHRHTGRRPTRYVLHIPLNHPKTIREPPQDLNYAERVRPLGVSQQPTLPAD